MQMLSRVHWNRYIADNKWYDRRLEVSISSEPLAAVALAERTGTEQAQNRHCRGIDSTEQVVFAC